MMDIRLITLLLGLSLTSVCYAEQDGADASERLGELEVGSSEQAVIRAVSCPFKHGKGEVWGADGRYYEDWMARKCGIGVTIGADDAQSAKSVHSIHIEAPSKLKTRRGIGIGSRERDVTRAYPQLQASELQSDQTRTIGSPEGELVFTLKKGRVTEIYVGVGDE